jgi:hypothetical protein
MREFKIGQYVYCRSRAEGRFVVMRLLPKKFSKTKAARPLSSNFSCYDCMFLDSTTNEVPQF